MDNGFENGRGKIDNGVKFFWRKILVGLEGLEPPTNRL
jgi:hypothetical protein